MQLNVFDSARVELIGLELGGVFCILLLCTWRAPHGWSQGLLRKLSAPPCPPLYPENTVKKVEYIVKVRQNAFSWIQLGGTAPKNFFLPFCVATSVVELCVCVCVCVSVCLRVIFCLQSVQTGLWSHKKRFTNFIIPGLPFPATTQEATPQRCGCPAGSLRKSVGCCVDFVWNIFSWSVSYTTEKLENAQLCQYLRLSNQIAAIFWKKNLEITQPQKRYKGLWMMRPSRKCFALTCPPGNKAIDSLSTKCKLQCKLEQNVTQISLPMTDRGVANSAH